MTTHYRRWPAGFYVGYLAQRAGMTRHAMLRRIKSIPALATLVKRGKWTWILLKDLKRAAPDFFESIQISEGFNPPEEDEAPAPAPAKASGDWFD